MIAERRIMFDNMIFAESRISALGDSFTALEVQIATVLLAFLGLFIDQFNLHVKDLSVGIVTFDKTIYIASVVSLVLSLTVGLIHIKRVEKFWETHHSRRVEKLGTWREILDKQKSEESGRAFMKGINAGEGNVSYSPIWSWIIQTVFMGTGVLLLLILLFMLILL